MYNTSPSFWGQKDQEYNMIIILLHILASDVGPRKKIKLLFLIPIWEKSGSEIPRTGKKLKKLFFPVWAFGELANPSTNQ
jgi:hypothetical protein